MVELFFDIFAYRDHAWTRADPRPKLVLALATILAIILSTRIVLPLALLALCLAALLALRIPPRLILERLAGPMGMVLVLILLQAFTRGSTAIWTFTLGGKELALTREGLWHGGLMGARVLGAVSVMLLFSAVTPAHKVFSALRWFRFPQGWVEIAMLMYRYTFVLLDHAADVASAQRVRLGYRGLRRSLSSLGTLAGAVLVRSIDQASHTHQAMMLRGYSGSIPLGPLPALRRREAGLALLVCLAVWTAYFILEGSKL